MSILIDVLEDAIEVIKRRADDIEKLDESIKRLTIISDAIKDNVPNSTSNKFSKKRKIQHRLFFLM